MAKERNTKKEIKEASATLTQLVSQLTTSGMHGLLGSLNEGQDKSQSEQQSLRKENEELRAQIKQLQEEKEVLKNTARQCNCCKINNELLESIKEYADILKVREYEWPDEFYKGAFVAEGSPLKASKETDLVILMETGEAAATNAGIRSIMLHRFPEMEGRIAALSINTRLETKESWSERTRHVYKAETGNLQGVRGTEGNKK